MFDRAHSFTDREIDALRAKFKATYEKAASEMREKLESHLAEFDKANKEWLDALKANTVTKKQYTEWLKVQSMRKDYLVGMSDALTRDALNTNRLVFDYINDAIPRVYSENANFMAYTIETGLGSSSGSFALYDQDTIRRIMGMGDDDQIIHEVIPYGPIPPDKELLQSVRVHPNEVKFVHWNREKFTASIAQSILQGESIPNTAKRLRRVLNMNQAMAVRAARTAMTSAENAGRVDSYRRAKKLGVDLEQEWLATLDERTRESHRELDGQHVPVGKYFSVPSNGHRLRFPGDPEAHGSETWNCFIGDTLATTDSEIQASYCHEYKGKLVTVDTASGVHFTCTPNHPILTPNGWVAAELLNNGDNLLITSRVNNHILGMNPDVKHRFASMKATHELFDMISGKRACILGMNFHGDVATSNVEVVAEKSFLRLCLNACRHKGVVELLFKDTDSLDLCDGATMKGLRRVMVAASRIMSGLGICTSFLWGHGSHANVHGLRAATRRDSSITEYAIDNLPAETMVRSELIRRLSRQVFVDKIVNVEVSSTRGTQVYNLQTGSGYYFANEQDNGNFIIAKNCRCTLIAWFPEDGQESLDNRWSDLPSGMTYAQWKESKAKSVGQIAKEKEDAKKSD